MINIKDVWRIIQLHLQFYLNLGFTQILMTLELGLYHTLALAGHLNRFPKNQKQIP